LKIITIIALAIIFYLIGNAAEGILNHSVVNVMSRFLIGLTLASLAFLLLASIGATLSYIVMKAKGKDFPVTFPTIW
jgi:hypothetical protein